MKRLKGFFNNSFFCSIFLCILFVAAMCFVLSHKVNYHVDEIFTYGKANYPSPLSLQKIQNTGWVFVPIDDGKIYTPGGKALMDYVVVHPQHRFDYANVWINEARAVHPPIHSALVHTIASFFPREFSLWFAASVNIVFAVLTLLVLRLLCRCYVQGGRVVNIISIAFAFSGGILSAVTFLRMYIMAMFWVILLTYCFVREVKDEAVNYYEFLTKVLAVTVCGAMTHYYCIVYAALISTTYGIWLLFRHRYREVFRFCGAMAAAGIISYFIFPAMIQHIFYGHRGLEVMRNAAHLSDFFSRLKAFSQIINGQIFGSLGYIFVLGAIVVCSSLIDDYYRTLNSDDQIGLSDLIHIIHQNLSVHYVLLIIPTVIFFIIVSKITVYREDRYIFPIYCNIILIMCLLVVHVFKLISVSKSCQIFLICITLCIITVKSWFTVGWPYLYLDSKEFLERSSKLSNVDAVCLYRDDWCKCTVFKESQFYKSIQFCNYNNNRVKQDSYKRIRNMKPEKLVVILLQPPGKHEIYLNDILKHSGSLNRCQKLGSFFYGYGTSYLLF